MYSENSEQQQQERFPSTATRTHLFPGGIPANRYVAGSGCRPSCHVARFVSPSRFRLPNFALRTRTIEICLSWCPYVMLVRKLPVFNFGSVLVVLYNGDQFASGSFRDWKVHLFRSEFLENFQSFLSLPTWLAKGRTLEKSINAEANVDFDICTFGFISHKKHFYRAQRFYAWMEQRIIVFKIIEVFSF